jgi:16S rRNA (uracil1498-N3)-methyltransferase
LHLFYQPDLSAGLLTGEESRHAVRVLRLNAGAEIDITDGKGQYVKAEIINPDSKACSFKILEKSSTNKRGFFVHLAIAPTKNADRMEWMVEKCVEIGVDAISFVLCKTSERKTINLERIEKVAISAMKQSQHYWLPQLNDIVPFDQFVQQASEKSKFIAFVDETNPDHLKSLTRPGTDSVVLVGPEGDFSNAELEAAMKVGFQKVSLGPNRLRTETAGLAAVMILNLGNMR